MADGSITFSTALDNKQLEKELNRLIKKIESIEAKIAGKTAERNQIAEQLKVANKEAIEAYGSVERLQNALKKSQAITSATGASVDLATYTRELDNQKRIKEELKEQEKILKQKEAAAVRLAAKDATAVAKLEQQEIELGKLKEQAEKIQSLLSVTNLFGAVFSRIKQISAKMGKVATNVAAAIVSGFTQAVKMLSVFSKLAGSLNGTLKRLGQSIKQAFVFSVIYKGLSLVKEQVSSYLLVNDEFTAALSRVKGALLTAFQPIYEVAVPAMTTLLNLLSRVIAATTQFTAALFGGTAKQAQSNAKALYEQANATEAVGNAAEDVAGSLAGFDEINTLSTGSNSGSGATAAAPAFDMALDDIVFDTWGEAFDAFLDKLLNTGIPAFEAGLAAMAEKANIFSAKLLEMFTFSEVVDKVKAVGENLAAAFNDLVASIDWNQFGQAAGAGFNTAIALAVAFLYSADWLDIGASLASMLNGIVSQIDWYNFGALLFAGFKIGVETLAGLILNLDMAQLALAASKLVIGFMNSVTETLAGIDWEGIGRQVKEFLVNVDWAGVAESTFTAIGAAFGALTVFLWGLIQDAWKEVVNWWHDAAFEDGKFTLEGLLDGIWNVIKNIGSWINKNIFQPFIEGFRKVFGIHSPSTVMAEMGNFLMDGLFNGIKAKINTVVTLVKSIFYEFTSFVKNVFAGDWEGAWDNISNIFKGVWNGIVDTLESAVNLIIRGVNWLISQLNKINFSFPSWIPGVGGKSYGINIPHIREVNIPRLATGSVIPPNREFLAVLGDNKTETEVVSPLSTMKQAVLEALRESGGAGSGTITVVVNLDGKEVARNQVKHINDMTRQAGKPVLLF